ncbi:hypothetical protein NIM87_06530 [Devosia sp. XJ19-1]|uniref:TonB C-terminal domain-containing protein n=1 Tax=Devosia ureilytica TaxID=2952754 RepID=A0A9Q4AMF0_9HYPH|nr:hypothetical protein [Devosia ureilytica]MCP8883148.1 hypothetical protein [Devosia ureilytica]MCP8886484.1 hypothetical protein [Devosia ureilytica]
MTRLFARLLVLAAFASPALGEEPAADPLTQEARAAQNLAIASAVQAQLLACWRLPSGYEGKAISVRLAFLGDGTLDGDPYVVPESLRTAGKYPVLMTSIGEAVERCLPFAGLEALGAEAGERFDITVHFQS